VESEVRSISIAVKNLAEATARYECLFGMRGVALPPDYFEPPGMSGTSFEMPGLIVNLVTSTDPSTAVSRHLDKRGEGFYLMTLTVDDLDAAAGELTQAGIQLALPQSRPAGHHGLVNFVSPKYSNGVLVELLQPATGAVSS
jgi:methylmalonyl-CoA/ethylmalonyl-CoA epimerase